MDPRPVLQRLEIGDLALVAVQPVGLKYPKRLRVAPDNITDDHFLRYHGLLRTGKGEVIGSHSPFSDSSV